MVIDTSNTRYQTFIFAGGGGEYVGESKRSVFGKVMNFQNMVCMTFFCSEKVPTLMANQPTPPPNL